MNSLTYLPFEEPLFELDQKILDLENSSQAGSLSLHQDLVTLKKNRESLLQKLYKNLDPWQIVQVARHPDRVHPDDLIENIFTEMTELEGDRHSAKAQAIFGGLARLAGQPVMVIAHKKGRTIQENLACNFSCAQPADFRKAHRLMRLAERFSIPVITFIDTKGAFPGIEAEEQNQSEAIAKNLLTMSELKTPIISVIIGEGCSGGALAIGVADRNYMLEYSYYAVISPEGCASILWRDAKQAPKAAEILQLTAKDLLAHRLIDKIILEPLGGAQQDPKMMAQTIQSELIHTLADLKSIPLEKMLQERYQRLRYFDR
jgi:acetyl-CoA carboxylase carboxyl transferase subunit alpha